MEKLEIPTAPAVLAVILGPIAEDSLRRALLISGGDPATLLARPISWLLAGLTVLAVLSPLRRMVHSRDAKKVEEGS